MTTPAEFAREYFDQAALIPVGEGRKDRAMALLAAMVAKRDEFRRGQRHADKPRNELFDALASACGCDPAQMTRRDARACAVALSEIVKVAPSLSPDEFLRRAAKYRKLYRDAPLTPSALCSHWAACANGSATVDSYAELAEPEGRAAWMRANLIDPSHADKPWSSFDRDEKQAIVLQMKQHERHD